MKKTLFILIVLVISFSFCSKNGKTNGDLEKKPILVKVESVHRTSLVNTLNYKGTVTAWKTANIVPEVQGRIGGIYKKQGDRVKKGDLLAELDLTALTLQQKQAQAAVAVAESAYKDAKLTYQRMKKLNDNNAVSQIQFEKAELGLDAADTQLKSAKANLDLVEYTLKNSSMRAPFDGVVASKNMEEGDIINPMMGMGASVMIVLDLSRVKVLIDVAAEDVEKINVEQPCTATVSSLEGEEFSGKVYSKNLAADPTSKTFKAEVVIDNPDMKIKAGVFADIRIETQRKDEIITLPLSSLVGDNEIVLYENGKAAKRRIKAGLRNHQRFEVVAGVNEGEQVIVEGAYDLKEGALITISGEKE